MTASKVSISLDPEVVARARADIAAGRAKSLSAWLNEAGRAQMERDDLASVLEEIFEATGGPPTEEELTTAAARLDSARRS